MLYNQDLGNTLNNMRAEIFKRKIAGKCHVAPKLCNLPPTMSSFEAHCKRAHFQAALWKAAGSPTTPDITPLDLGWEVCGSMLRPQHGSPGQLPAPDEVMNLIKCGCKAGCSSALCTCAKLSLTCTAVCKCKGSFFCKNPNTVSTTDLENPSD